MKFVVSRVSLLLAGLHLLGTIISKPIQAQAIVPTPNIVNATPIAKPNTLVAETPAGRIEAELERGNVSEAVMLIENVLEKQFENYFQTNFSDNPMTAKEISDVLGKMAIQTGKKPALFYVKPHEKLVELVLVTPGKPPIHKRLTDTNQEMLRQKAIEFRNMITDPTIRDATNYLPISQQLYKWIVAPIESELQAQGIDTLIFCLGGIGLRTMPLEPLHDGQKFLVEKYSIARIPVFRFTDTSYVNLKNSQVLVMGASEFKEQNPLPAVPVEISAIAQQLWQGKSFLNQEFTLANLRSQRASQPYQIVHLATHADFLPGTPKNSYIQFWDKRLTLDEAGMLGLKKPPVELLVLSACRTAVGDQQAELGFAGLAVQSGVKSALASLWYVSDEATLALMTQFYRHLQTVSTKAEALRQAQIDMIKGQVQIANGQLQSTRGNIPLPPALANIENENLSHPYYWAGFTVVGSPW